jgi:hypothetical protein
MPRKLNSLLRSCAAFSLATVLCLVVCPAASLEAQVDRTGLNGTITDPAGRVLGAVHVIATEDSTGLRRETTSSAYGVYDIPELPVGAYTVVFAHQGFQQLRVTGVKQAIGRTRTLDVSLKVAGAEENVVVAGTTLDLNETSSALGARLEKEQVRDLPLNGRNWATLTALAPGAIDTGGSNQRTIRFAGRGLDDNNFTEDGIDASNIVNQAQQPFVRLAIPTDTIEEFRVESMLFTAESGSTPGGQVDVTTASGTNRWHGDAFDFLRNDVFDARNPFDHDPQKAPFHLNQFGGSIGGPIVRNKTFFYAAFEGVRQDLGQILQGFVPTVAFRNQVLSQSPQLAPILNAYPQGQTPINAQVAGFTAAGKQLDHENAAMVRLDQHITESSTAFARFNMDEAVGIVPLGSSGQFLNDRQDISSRPVNGVVEFLHIFSPQLVNEAKFGFNRGTVITVNASQNGLPFSVAVPGFTAENNNESRIGVGNSFSWINNTTWVRGPQVLKAGVEIRRVQLNQGNTENGSLSFASLNAFALDQVNSASLASALPVNGLRKTEYYAFIQDEFKWKPNFTINLGLRYQFYNRFHEVLGRAVPFDFATCGPLGFCPAGAEFSRPNMLDLDPRAAFVWAPRALRGKTVIHSGFGIYHGDGQLDDQNLPISNEVQRFSLSQATLPNLTFPITPFLAGVPGVVSARDMDRLRKDMYVSQWGLSVQQSLPASFVGTLSYVGSKGTHLLTTSFVNTIDPATGARPFPAFGQVEFRGNLGDSAFEALQASLQRPFKHGLLLSFHYMWSHEIDNDSPGGGDADFPQDPECPRCERASGNFDVRHLWNMNVIYQLPFGGGRLLFRDPGLLRAIFGSWSVTSILSGRTGLPLNVTIDRLASDVPGGNTTSQRPNLVPGVPLTPPGGSTPAEWLNPAAFAVPAPGTFGDAPRNVARGPGLWQADAGLTRQISVTERVRIDLRAEAFNIFNRPQYGASQTDLSALSSFGAILATVNTGPVGTGTPRQIQFMLRVGF